MDLSLSGDAGLLYVFEGSTNLVNWSWLGVRSNATGTVLFTDLRATNYVKRFYRASIPEIFLSCEKRAGLGGKAVCSPKPLRACFKNGFQEALASRFSIRRIMQIRIIASL